jgi:hypothetical protein
MNGRLASLLVLVLTLAAGFGVGRALGSDDTATTTTTTTTTTTVPEAATSPISDEGPSLAELVPGLDAPLYLETGDPTQLLRWDPDAPLPVPVRNLPAGSDLTMDGAGRFLFLAMPGGTGQLLLGGLADTPPLLFTESMSHFPALADFSDTFWFLEGDEAVAMTTWGDERHRGPWRPELGEDVVIDFESGPILEAADDSGAVVFWYYLPDGGEVVFTRSFVSADGTLSLPSEPDTQVAAFTETHIILRTDIGALIGVDKATGAVEDVEYDGSCGRTLVREDGTRASVCGGVAIILTDPAPIIDAGTWTEGRWSASGEWFMAVSARFGEVLLVDVAGGVAHTVAVPLAGQTTLLDVWSGM